MIKPDIDVFTTTKAIFLDASNEMRTVRVVVVGRRVVMRVVRGAWCVVFKIKLKIKIAQCSHVKSDTKL
jgi:hypothetical protein